ncbi:hypothetical protein Pla175_41320 [Pirellulimonas nuda]|uniref:Uncharacterized protein n=2 Tax=Pirellulimonas nuda TaxID=2528009 RepID=A0A518DGW7_9BACT|nr:hypothetical protein Pla175_41320 [Pirellulimonas nuda]
MEGDRSGATTMLSRTATKRWAWAGRTFVGAVWAVAAVCAIGYLLGGPGWTPIDSAASPDGGTTAVVSQNWSFIDRNLRVTLQRRGEGAERVVFTSPDEGAPDEGARGETERLHWSPDGDFLLLTGEHFFVEADAPRDGDAALYWLYAADTGEMWCNSPQTSLPRFSLSDAQSKGLDFVRGAP